MFGIGKAVQEELQKSRERLAVLERLTEEAADKASVLESGAGDLENSQKQMKINMDQVDENTAAASEQAEQNITHSAELIGRMKETADEMEGSEKEYEAIKEQFKGQLAECTELVDKNKYFTPPAKVINEAPRELKGINGSCLDTVDRVEEYSKQIGVIALNMAIEAGRLGDGGHQFVSAAEEVRKFATAFEDLIKEMKTLITLSDKKLDALEEQSTSLIGLLKDSNVATVHLYKTLQKTDELVDDASIRNYSQDVRQWREELTGIRNTEEEILKLQERDKLQNEDIRSEMEAQKKALDNITEKIGPVLREAKDHAGEKDRES